MSDFSFINGKEYILDTDSLTPFHYSSEKLVYANKIGNWFSPLNSGLTKDKELVQYLFDEPLWELAKNDAGYNYIYKLKKPLKLLMFQSDDTDKTIDLVKDFLNKNKALLDKHKNEDWDFNDYEYLFAYYLSKFTDFDGWVTNCSAFGFFILYGNTENLLDLQTVETNFKEQKISYSKEQWLSLMNVTY